MILGLDTSNYTTSVSVVDMDGKVVYEKRKILPVKEGNRGLRQSEAVFEHVRNLPLLTEGIEKFDIRAVCASVSPRNVEGSYMPCFLVGKNFGKSFSDILNIPFFETSHQEGHIAAALSGNGPDPEEDFLFAHLSGGTTEILLCRQDGAGFKADIVGQTSDISAGQFIDRVGVLLGMKFPCGAQMDRYFDRSNKAFALPSSVKGSYVSFSGVETKINAMIKDGNISNEDVISAVFRCVGRSVGRLIENAAKEYGVKNILLGGGVSSSTNIRNLIKNELHRSRSVYSAPEGLSADNSVGVSLIGLNYFGGING